MLPCCATFGYGFWKAPVSPEKAKPEEGVAKSESRGAVMVGKSRNAEVNAKADNRSSRQSTAAASQTSNERLPFQWMHGERLTRTRSATAGAGRSLCRWLRRRGAQTVTRGGR